MDDIDLLDATIDPTDVKTLQKVEKLKTELKCEEMRIKCKLVWKAAWGPDDPLKID